MWQDLKARLGGLVLIALGLGLGWYFVLGPLQEARQGVPEVRYFLKIFAIVPLCIICGLGFVLFGERLKYADASRQNLTATGWFMFVLIAVATAAGFWWFKEQFAALGYR
ncbi:hypothetical protein [Bosea sp. 685]|uniref:hypothetical protein n=1 Tax=Bosea sp. 685 TaxID=3080057 RepID=UPI002892E5B8|nr:hypothetical protein [Bosea sp. 685]WNJ92128.1 hypothetical protein RMR04_07480 [Bosea sp. 685]